MLKKSVRSRLVPVLLFLLTAGHLYSQTPPADFLIRASTGGIAPWSEIATVTIDAQGQGTYLRYRSGDFDTALAESTFTVTSQSVQALWQAVQTSQFSTLASSADSTFRDGTFAKITVTANGASHQVTVRNSAYQQIQALLASLNAALPPPLQLLYSPPSKVDSPPRDPCEPPQGFNGVRPLNSNLRVPDPKLAAQRPAQADALALAVASHPGTVVAYSMPLEQAVGNRIATMRSKGRFFGDAVSVTVDNRNPKPAGDIDITLYLEFWGPYASPQVVANIINDIAAKWSGRTTSTGQKVNMRIVPRVNRNATSPPGTPGFHEIQIVPDGQERSHVGGDPKVNQGSGSGVWETDQNPGVYAHEAGHLMGLPDRYDDYNKQPDGSWVNENTGAHLSRDDLAQRIVTKYPAKSLEKVKQNLDRQDLISLAQDGYEQDLMAVASKPPSQAEVDLLTGNPGLLVHIPAGGVLANKSGGEQNIVITRGDDLFVKPGERRTLKGIYGACIDHSKMIPDSTHYFDLIPPLDQWRGIAAAGYLVQLIRYIDSAALYCGSFNAAQEAIWRITDNTRSFFAQGEEDSVLVAAGVQLGDQVLDFPRLSSRSENDTVSSVFVPDQLYAADIQPRFAAGAAGSPAAFTANVAAPSGSSSATSFIWTALGPDSTAVPVSSSGATGTLTPARSGIFEVGLTVSVTEPGASIRSFPSFRKAYLVVPDSLTETFERGVLPDRFPWKSSGNAAWVITAAGAQTGSFAAQPGDLSGGQTAELAIEVNLPQPGFVSFSIRTATMVLMDLCEFDIDSSFAGVFSGLTDWLVVSRSLDAGKHTLSWTAQGGSDKAANVWLDNIFFPAGSVVTAVGEASGAAPLAFQLDQNYPNPFNPSTTIRYAVPGRSHVTLTVFNTLGQQVATLVNSEIDAGYHSVQFDARNLASGVYFYRLQAGSFVDTKKLLLVR